jgi:hypothetical protein
MRQLAETFLAAIGGWTMYQLLACTRKEKRNEIR